MGEVDVLYRPDELMLKGTCKWISGAPYKIFFSLESTRRAIAQRWVGSNSERFGAVSDSSLCSDSIRNTRMEGSTFLALYEIVNH